MSLTFEFMPLLFYPVYVYKSHAEIAGNLFKIIVIYEIGNLDNNLLFPLFGISWKEKSSTLRDNKNHTFETTKFIKILCLLLLCVLSLFKITEFALWALWYRYR